MIFFIRVLRASLVQSIRVNLRSVRSAWIGGQSAGEL